jgi:hypothetical protein
MIRRRLLEKALALLDEGKTTEGLRALIKQVKQGYKPALEKLKAWIAANAKEEIPDHIKDLRAAVTYHVYVNDSSLLFLVDHRWKGKPDAPKLYYSGGDHALLYRSPGQIILFEYLVDWSDDRTACVAALKTIDTVLVWEDGKKKAYTVEVCRESDLPIPEQELTNALPVLFARSVDQ